MNREVLQADTPAKHELCGNVQHKVFSREDSDTPQLLLTREKQLEPLADFRSGRTGLNKIDDKVVAWAVLRQLLEALLEEVELKNTLNGELAPINDFGFIEEDALLDRRNLFRRALWSVGAPLKSGPHGRNSVHSLRVNAASIRQPANENVIRYLERHGPKQDEREPHIEKRDYWEAGSHPDVVERVWDELGKALPSESRRVVCGTPALIHPNSKVLIAIAIGTQYALRLPSLVVRAGIPANAQTEIVWAGGTRLNVQTQFGPDWIFGNYFSEEEMWCRQTFEEYSAIIRE